MFITELFTIFVDQLASFLDLISNSKRRRVVTLHEDLIDKYSRTNTLIFDGKKYPIVVLASRWVTSPEFSYDFIKNDQHFKVPSEIKDFNNLLFKKFSKGTVYNSTTIRIDDFNYDEENERITLSYSLASYYDALLTNKSIDVKWDKHRTAREVFEPGPFLRPLSESVFANHIGVNVIVMTSDNKVVLVKRGKNLSSNRNSLGVGVSGSIKVKYALDDDKSLNISGVVKAISKEISDEISLTNDFSSSGIIAFYRSILEGGKPDILAFYRTKQSSTEIVKGFDRFKKKFDTDGNKLVFLDIEELRNVLANDHKRFSLHTKSVLALFLSLFEIDS